MRTFAAILVAIFGYSALATVGGSDAGGGGAVQEPSATAQEIIHGSAISKGSVLMWLNQKEYDFRAAVAQDPSVKDREPGLTKIFLGSTTIFDVIPKVTIQVQEHEPCYNKFGDPWDGSIYPRGDVPPHTICISSFNLQKKLTHEDYDFEIAALVLHEISHFFGTTEDEAIHLQTLCQEDILKFDFLATWPQINNYNFAVGEVDDLIKNKPKNLAGSYNYWFDLYHKAQKIYPYLDCSNSMYDAKLSLLRARERDDLLANFAKLVVIGDFACSMDPESPYAKDCLAQTNALFAGAEVVSTSKVLGLQDMSCFAHYDQFPQSDPQITRVRSLADFGRQLDEVSTGFQGFVKSIYQFQDLSTFKFPLIIVKNQAQIKGLRN